MPRDHYIPQFYLRNFTDLHTPPGHEPYLWVLDIDEASIKKRAPKKVASEKGFYDLTDSKEKHEVERLYSRLESVVAPVVQRLDHGGEVCLESRVILATFVSSLKTRGPWFRSVIGDMIERTMKRFNKTIASDPELFERMIAEFEAKTGQKIEIPLEEFREFVGGEGYTIATTNTAGMQWNVGASPETARILASMKWMVIRVPENADHFLVTSDRPVALLNPALSPDGLFGPGLLQEGIEVTLPLTRRTCIFARWKGAEGETIASPELVEMLNQRRVWCARRFVYSPQNSRWLQERLPSFEDEAETGK